MLFRSFHMASSAACCVAHEQTPLGRRRGPEPPCPAAASAWAHRASCLAPPRRPHPLPVSGQHRGQSPPQGQETSGLLAQERDLQKQALPSGEHPAELSKGLLWGSFWARAPEKSVASHRHTRCPQDGGTLRP